MSPPSLQVRVHSATYECAGIHSYELRPVDGGHLPSFGAGAHIDLHLANRLIRSYSLINPQSETRRYVIAVNKDAASRGGSKFVHESLRVGDVITIDSPRNNFPLAEDAAHSLLIAGGIGVTPLWCMAQRLASLGLSWELIYCARTRAHAAFAGPIEALAARSDGSVRFNFDHEPGGKMLDLAAVVNAAAPQTHLYCCGPTPMLAAFELVSASRPSQHVHVEYFTAKEAPATMGGYTVELAKTGRSIAIPAGRTILETLLEAGIDVPYSCMEGVCGTCETKVVAGTPDHRDLLLTRDEQTASKSMMICCSGCKGDRLVLEL